MTALGLTVIAGSLIAGLTLFPFAVADNPSRRNRRA